MFKLQPKPTFKTVARISIPGQEAPADVEIEFKHLGVKAIKAFFTDIGERTDAESLAMIVVGWKGVDTEFSQEALATFLDNYPQSAGELFDAFRKSALESRTKNS